MLLHTNTALKMMFLETADLVTFTEKVLNGKLHFQRLGELEQYGLLGLAISGQYLQQCALVDTMNRFRLSSYIYLNISKSQFFLSYHGNPILSCSLRQMTKLILMEKCC